MSLCGSSDPIESSPDRHLPNAVTLLKICRLRHDVRIKNVNPPFFHPCFHTPNCRAPHQIRSTEIACGGHNDVYISAYQAMGRLRHLQARNAPYELSLSSQPFRNAATTSVPSLSSLPLSRRSHQVTRPASLRSWPKSSYDL